ncbi:MAG: U32 family peptidase [Lachnospiraceae bacterium]|nr:U32 family peptidase [Lachnospiraceae bacterium]
MNKTKYEYELLAPAGSFESLKAAFAAGADAVYIGGTKFGARAFADSTSADCIAEAIDYAHLRDKKLYLTVNTLFKEDEIRSELYSYILPYYEQGLDAVIVQDIGVMDFLHREFPGLKLHASTQMTITGADGARWAKDMGAVRIVTARELSLSDIKYIKDNVDIEIETFVHGAMCYCYSGQCLMSSMIGGRSGNRGRCAQPCRLPYDVISEDGRVLTERGNNYVLSLKDMCTIDMLPKLMEAGIDSFKIEGRMKSPVYTAGVVSIYRKYMDMYLECGAKDYRVEQADKDMLLKLFDRGGQTDGYLRGIKGKSMMAFKEKPAFKETDRTLTEYIEDRYINNADKLAISGYATFLKNKQAEFTVSLGDVFVTQCGGIVTEALNRPMLPEEIEKRLAKTGGTDYVFNKLEMNVDDNIFVSVKDINELRRTAIARLEEAVLSEYKRTATKPGVAPESDGLSDSQSEDSGIESILTPRSRCFGDADAPVRQSECFDDADASVKQSECFDRADAPDMQDEKSRKPDFNIYVETAQQLKTAVASGKADNIYLDSASFPPQKALEYVDYVHKYGIGCIYVLPAVFERSTKDVFDKYFIDIADRFDAVAVKTIDEAQWLIDNTNCRCIIGEGSLYAYNSLSKAYLQRQGINHFVIPAELNFGELLRAGHTGSEIPVYGRTPLMVTSQCIVKNTMGCSKTPQQIYIRDRKQMSFPVKNKCTFCYNMLYNSVCTSLAGCRQKVERLSPRAVRLDFTIEDGAECSKIIDLYYRCFVLNEHVEIENEKYTKGHFLRGIE